MSTYVIGDVHGCYDELQMLIKKIKFNKNKDSLIFLGDLVNRGRDSLKVLNFCINNRDSVTTVLGNHDLYLLRLMVNGSKHLSMNQVLNDNKKVIFFNWLIKKPLILKKIIKNRTYFIVHAGILPEWSLKEAMKYAKEIGMQLRKDPKHTLNAMWGNKPSKWKISMNEDEFLRFVINCFTRMRFCHYNGSVNFQNKQLEQNDNYFPWFIKRELPDNHKIIFGHWAAIRGKTHKTNILGLDTGCVWGGKLTALRLEDEKYFRVDKQ